MKSLVFKILMKMTRQHSVLKKKTLDAALGGAMLVIGAAASMQAHATVGSTIVSNTSATYNISSSADNVLTVADGVTMTGAPAVYWGFNTATETFTNLGTITGTGGNYAISVASSGSIGTLINQGTISNWTYAVYNLGTIGTFDNAGYITDTSGSAAPVVNGGTISLLLNEASGTLAGAPIGVINDKLITKLENDGLITGITGISNESTAVIGSIENNGTIAASNYAIYNPSTSSIGTITNTGVIQGNIFNAADAALVFVGGTTTYGTLTGPSGGVGTITSTVAGVTFASGNIALNDNISIGSNTLSSAANLLISSPLTINGGYSQANNTTITSAVINNPTATGTIDTDSGYGRLYVSGTATLGTGVSVVLSGTSYAFASGQRFVIIDGDAASTYNTTTGTYTATNYTGAVTGSTVTLDNGRQELVLSLGGGTSNSSLPTTQTAISSLNGLGKYSGLQAGLLDLYNASLAIGSTGEANRVGAQLAPTQNFSASTATSSATFDALNVVGAHVDAVRLAQAGGATGIATGDSPQNWAAWGQVYGGHASQGMVNNVSGYTATYGGLVAGVDRALGERWRAGGAFVYSNTSVHGSDDVSGNTSSVNSYGAIGYASYTGEPWYVNVSASAALQQYNSNRAVSFTGFSGTAKGEFNGSQYVAKAEFGYPLGLPNGFTVTPLAAVSYSYQHQNAYTESGGNGAALNVGSTHNNALRSSLGAKLERAFPTRFGDAVPFVQALWTHQYNSGRASTTASYAADTVGETSFTTLGAAPVRDLAEIRTGVNLLRGTSTSISLRYDLQVASQYTAHTVSLRLRQLF